MMSGVIEIRGSLTFSTMASEVIGECHVPYGAAFELIVDSCRLDQGEANAAAHGAVLFWSSGVIRTHCRVHCHEEWRCLE